MKKSSSCRPSGVRGEHKIVIIFLGGDLLIIFAEGNYAKTFIQYETPEHISFPVDRACRRDDAVLLSEIHDRADG